MIVESLGKIKICVISVIVIESVVFPVTSNKNIRLLFPTISKIWKEKFLKTLKCSSGQVECSFDNPAEDFPPNVRKFFALSLKIVLTIF